MSKLDDLIKNLCLNGVEYKAIDAVVADLEGDAI